MCKGQLWPCVYWVWRWGVGGGGGHNDIATAAVWVRVGVWGGRSILLLCVGGLCVGGVWGGWGGGRKGVILLSGVWHCGPPASQPACLLAAPLTPAPKPTFQDPIINHDTSGQPYHPDLQAYHPGLNPTQAYHPDLNPPQAYHPDLNPTQAYHPDLHPTQAYHPDLHPTQAYHPDLNPTQAYLPDLNPTQAYHPDLNPTQAYSDPCLTCCLLLPPPPAASASVWHMNCTTSTWMPPSWMSGSSQPSLTPGCC